MAIEIVTMLVPPIAKLLDKVIPDKDEREKLAHEIATLTEKLSHEQIMAQIEVNKQEAAHKSVFVAGWRPAAGWVCVLGMGFNYLIAPVFDLAAADMNAMMPVLMGMLGMGALRTVEKTKGVAKQP